jgi:hypothetical protein
MLNIVVKIKTYKPDCTILPKSLKMKKAILILVLLFITVINGQEKSKPKKSMEKTIASKTEKLLRHVVLFKFKEDTSIEKIKEIEIAFQELPLKIKEIYRYEWGLNNSPENLNKGFTHCFFLTFKNEADRAIYLPHPDHMAFGEIITPHLEDVLVLDYWSN